MRNYLSFLQGKQVKPNFTEKQTKKENFETIPDFGCRRDKSFPMPFPVAGGSTIMSLETQWVFKLTIKQNK